MEKFIQLALPVMLHFEKDIEAFLNAQRRINLLGDSLGVALEVGAFLPFMPNHSREPENFEKQLKNQAKYRLPIKLVETGIQRNNALSYVPGNPTFNEDIPSDLENIIEQTAKIRDLDPKTGGELVVAPHVGVLILDSMDVGDFSRPSIYSPQDFIELRNNLYDKSKERFLELREKALELGLKLSLENAPPVTFENYEFWQKKDLDRYEMCYHAFNDIHSLLDISGGSLIFDAGHYAASMSVPELFERNKADSTLNSLFSVMGISLWNEYIKRIGEAEDYLAHAVSIHISHTDGIGVRLKRNSPEGTAWGDGRGDDLTTMKSYNNYFNVAKLNSLPIAIEEDYNLSPLTFEEADKFLEPIFRNYNPN